MEHTTSLRERALNWWRDLPSQRCLDFMNNLGLEWGFMTDEMVETIYLKEQETKFKLWKESNQNGTWEEWMNLPLYSKEHPTEAKVTKQADTLDKAAERWIMGEGDETQRMYGHHYRSFKAGAEWEKEQDRVLISELSNTLSKIVGSMSLERVERFDLNQEAKSAITKAEKHLNNQ